MLDKAKLALQARKLQKELADEIIEVVTGAGAVTVKISGEQKLKKIKIDETKVDFDDIDKLEKLIEDAVREGMTKAQSVATEKLKPLMDQMGGLGF